MCFSKSKNSSENQKFFNPQFLTPVRKYHQQIWLGLNSQEICVSTLMLE